MTVGQDPIGVATGAGAVWVANSADGSVSKVSPASVTVTQTTRVGGDPLALGVSGGEVYVGDGTAQTVRTVSPAPGSKTLSIGTDPRALLPVSAGVWVAASNPGRVLAVAPS